jgi:hypothetical protein
MLVINPKSVGNSPCTCSIASPKELLSGTLYIFLLNNEFKQIAHTYVGLEQKTNKKGDQINKDQI